MSKIDKLMLLEAIKCMSKIIWTAEFDFVEQEVNEEDEKALQMFMSKDPPVRRTLADIIMEKITEKQTEIRTQMSGEGHRVC